MINVYNRWKIYEISSSKSNKYYVGVTCRSIEKRLYDHLHSKNKNSKKVNWINKYKDSIQIIQLVGNLTEVDAYLLEEKLIKSYRELYGKRRILNLDNGGKGGRAGIETSSETKLKQSLV